MSGTDRIARIVIYAAAIVAIGLAWMAFKADAACTANGGERMRPLWGQFKCYDKASLKEIKP